MKHDLMEITEKDWLHQRDRIAALNRRAGVRTIGYEGRHFVAYYHFIGLDCISLGLHVCWRRPNIEIHLPFGFIRIGRSPWRFVPDPQGPDT